MCVIMGDAILGLFFANEDEMVYDKIKIEENLSQKEPGAKLVVATKPPSRGHRNECPAPARGHSGSPPCIVPRPSG